MRSAKFFLFILFLVFTAFSQKPSFCKYDPGRPECAGEESSRISTQYPSFCLYDEYHENCPKGKEHREYVHTMASNGEYIPRVRHEKSYFSLLILILCMIFAISVKIYMDDKTSESMELVLSKDTPPLLENVTIPKISSNPVVVPTIKDVPGGPYNEKEATKAETKQQLSKMLNDQMTFLSMIPPESLTTEQRFEIIRIYIGLQQQQKSNELQEQSMTQYGEIEKSKLFIDAYYKKESLDMKGESLDLKAKELQVKMARADELRTHHEEKMSSTYLTHDLGLVHMYIILELLVFFVLYFPNQLNHYKTNACRSYYFSILLIQFDASKFCVVAVDALVILTLLLIVFLTSYLGTGLFYFILVMVFFCTWLKWILLCYIMPVMMIQYGYAYYFGGSRSKLKLNVVMTIFFIGISATTYYLI